MAVARSAAFGPGAARLAGWLVGAEAERLLVARAPGVMPLRAGIPVPVGVRPAGNVVGLALDRDAVAAEKRRLLPALARWAPAPPVPRP